MFALCGAAAAIPVTVKQVTTTPDQLPKESGHPHSLPTEGSACASQRAVTALYCTPAQGAPESSAAVVGRNPTSSWLRRVVGGAGTGSRAQCPVVSKEPLAPREWTGRPTLLPVASCQKNERARGLLYAQEDVCLLPVRQA